MKICLMAFKMSVLNPSDNFMQVDPQTSDKMANDKSTQCMKFSFRSCCPPGAPVHLFCQIPAFSSR